MHAQSSYVVGSLCHSIHLRIYTSGVVYIFLHFHTEDHTLHKQKENSLFRLFTQSSYGRTFAFQFTDSVYESCDCTCIVLVNTLQDTKLSNYIIMMNEHMHRSEDIRVYST